MVNPFEQLKVICLVQKFSSFKKPPQMSAIGPHHKLVKYSPHLHILP
jgi:hypothetical protein